MAPRAKLRIGEIDWSEIERGCTDLPYEEGGTVALNTQRLRRTMHEATPFVLTESFVERLAIVGKGLTLGDVKDWPMQPTTISGPVVYQMETPDAGPASRTLLLIHGTNMVMFPISTGGASFYGETPDPDGGTPYYRMHIPEAFRHEDTTPEDVQRYGVVMAIFARLATALLAVPEVNRVETVKSHRTVSKGRSMRVPEYRVVTLYPGAEHIVRQRVAARKAAREKRTTPAQHEVTGHWISRRLAPDCLHVFEDITTDEVLKRERCTICEGHRTYRRGFKRGDPKRQPRKKVHVVR